MAKSFRRVPKGYDGTQVTTHPFNELLTGVLTKIQGAYKERPDVILASWPQIIGPVHAKMTRAESFIEGVLTVTVNNSTSYSLLTRNDKPKILLALRKAFPNVNIKDIFFRIG